MLFSAADCNGNSDLCTLSRCTIMQSDMALCCANWSASWSKGWYSTMRVGSTPQLADRMILGLQSSIRVANSL